MVPIPERTVSVGLVADATNYLSGMKAARGATNDLGATVETTGEKSRRLAEKVGGGISRIGSSLGGELGEVLTGVGEGIDTVASKAGKLAHGLEIGGGVATTAGIGLLNLSSDLKQSTDLLGGAIENAGGSAEEYEKQIEGAVQAGQNLGHNAVEVKNALTTVVNATGDTAKSFKYMAVVTDLAASKHISLESAATQVAKILNGSGGKTLAQYGITMEKAYDNTNDLAKGHDRLLKAEQGVKNAQTQLTRLTEIDGDKTKLTTAEKFRLADAHKKVKDAQALVAQETQQLNDLQGKSVTKTDAGKAAITQLAEKLDGQGSKSVDNFSSQVGIAVTKVKDWVDEIAGPLGQVLTVIGPTITAAGVIIDIYRTKQEAAAKATAAAAAASTLAVGAEKDLAGATVGLNAVMDANPIGLVALAIGAVGAAVTVGMIAKQQDLTEATKEYTSAIEADNGALATNVKALATKKLLEDGSLAAAQKLGIGAGLVVDAVLGEAGARKKLGAEIKAATDANKADNDELTKSGTANADLTRKVSDTSKALKTLTAGIGDQNDAIKGARKDNQLTADALHHVGDEAGYAASLVRSYNIELDKTPEKVTTRLELNFEQHKGVGRATGGVVGFGETTLVGERGPELVKLPAGSRVYPTGTGPSYSHMSSAPQSSGGGVTFNIPVQVSAGVVSEPTALARTLTDAITNGVRNGVPADWYLRR